MSRESRGRSISAQWEQMTRKRVQLSTCKSACGAVTAVVCPLEGWRPDSSGSQRRESEGVHQLAAALIALQLGQVIDLTHRPAGLQPVLEVCLDCGHQLPLPAFVKVGLGGKQGPGRATEAFTARVRLSRSLSPAHRFDSRLDLCCPTHALLPSNQIRVGQQEGAGREGSGVAAGKQP